MNNIFLLLQPYLQSTQVNKPCLLIADENLIDIPYASLNPAIQVLSNRFDITHQAQLANSESLFNDFDFSVFASGHFKRIVYRVSKEKSVTHHIINHALRLLDDGGELILLGAKNEGIKTYISKAAAYFNIAANTDKHGKYYLATLQKKAALAHEAESRVLPLKAPYTNLAAVITCGDDTLYSKPGLFGWNKVDRGSALLAQYLGEFFTRLPAPPRTLLDLGCGYGYLSIKAAQVQSVSPLQITASDNCAAAVLACQKNFAAFSLKGKVVADDCADSITGSFDAVISNPPFHQGFKTDSRLTEKFIQSAARHLKHSGSALFVVNQFVALEKLARPVFARSEKIAESDGFKLVVLSKN